MRAVSVRGSGAILAAACPGALLDSILRDGLLATFFVPGLRLLAPSRD
jgi:hypothetical protein